MGNEVGALERELDNLRHEFRKEIRELMQGVVFLSRHYQNMKSDCESVKSENVALKTAQEPLLEEILALKNK
ncbi:hypothetical protein HPB50_011585 [Hyalomma asiaticum]|uniref:Uncharacterized protein n=1 Tax=Hyalomma asiaticum TaxID=266040 RepID=A0ACB7RT82_HYAAI|nr:hypothetical protein HPB50_011585 [Hyalomma asiaticum]